MAKGSGYLDVVLVWYLDMQFQFGIWTWLRGFEIINYCKLYLGLWCFANDNSGAYR